LHSFSFLHISFYLFLALNALCSILSFLSLISIFFSLSTFLSLVSSLLCLLTRSYSFMSYVQIAIKCSTFLQSLKKRFLRDNIILPHPSFLGFSWIYQSLSSSNQNTL
jgi:hypothetical protein